MVETTAPGTRATSRIGLIVWIVSGCALLVLLVCCIIGYLVIASAHTPQKAVAAYLGAVQHGDVSDALRLGGVKVTSSDLLLTRAAYRAATDHVIGYSLSGAVTNGDGAAVTAEITQGTDR